MSISPDDKPNPYQSPASVAPTVGDPVDLDRQLGRTLGVFQTQMLGLGAFWIGCAIIAGSTGLGDSGWLDLDANDPPKHAIMSIGLIMAAILWLVSGVMTCFKQMWAVYVGMGLSCVFLLCNLIWLQLLPIALMVV